MWPRHTQTVTGTIPYDEDDDHDGDDDDVVIVIFVIAVVVVVIGDNSIGRHRKLEVRSWTKNQKCMRLGK